MAAYVKGADVVREALKCAVIVIHHNGHDDRRPRGHTALLGAADAQIAVRNADGTITALVEYMKDGEAGVEIHSRLKVVELDADQDGETVTSRAIEPAVGAARPAGPKKKVGPAAQQALSLLRNAVDTADQPLPPSVHVPEGARGVTKSVWRGYCEKGGIINADGNPKTTDYAELIVTLKDAGLIGVWDDFVWIVTERHKVSQ